uniref:mitogen-activated protein kinase n=1 Tax=Macrostomum lignano TaxID=282301 RepID=A0A1I8FX20_9PLAT
MTMNSEVEPHITKKYEIKKRLGKGAYGIVWKAIDRRTGEVVALKKIFDAFRNQTDAQRTFREIAFLQEFADHPNIVKLLNVIKAENDKDIYLVFESMDTDLHNVIKKGNILKDVHKQYIMYQMFKATYYVHSGNCIHRDQKPSNVLLDSECFVKLCDFGLARSLSQLGRVDEGGADPALTEYVATRWYRAPEILLASHRYTKGVDMWSLGCILGEMLLGKPLFPGSSTLNQIERIMSAIPSPSQEDIRSIGSAYGASILEKAAVRGRRSLESLVPNVDPVAMDLMQRLLQFNPDKRLTAEEALRHPYVRRFHNPAEEIALRRDVVPPVDDNSQLSVAEYRNRLYEMIVAKKAARRQRRREERERRRQERQHQDQQQPQTRASTSSSVGEASSAATPAPDSAGRERGQLHHHQQQQPQHQPGSRRGSLGRSGSYRELQQQLSATAQLRASRSTGFYGGAGGGTKPSSASSSASGLQRQRSYENLSASSKAGALGSSLNRTTPLHNGTYGYSSAAALAEARRQQSAPVASYQSRPPTGNAGGGGGGGGGGGVHHLRSYTSNQLNTPMVLRDSPYGHGPALRTG